MTTVCRRKIRIKMILILKVDIDGKRITDNWYFGTTKILNYTVNDKEVHEVG